MVRENGPVIFQQDRVKVLHGHVKLAKMEEYLKFCPGKERRVKHGMVISLHFPTLEVYTILYDMK